jgi:hypothetical protein
MNDIERGKISTAIGILQSLIPKVTSEVEQTPFGAYIRDAKGKRVRAFQVDGKWFPAPEVKPVDPVEPIEWSNWNILPSAPFVYDDVPAPEGFEYRYHPQTGERKIVVSCETKCFDCE